MPAGTSLSPFWLCAFGSACVPWFVGIEKFGAYRSVAQPLIDPATGQPDASGVMVNVNIKSYALANYVGIPAALKDKFAHDPLLPKFVLTAFDRMLGPAFILTGIMLLDRPRYTPVSAGAGRALYRIDHPAWF